MKKTIYFLLTLCFFVGGITAQADDTHGTKGELLTAEQINEGGRIIFMHVDCEQKQCYAGSENHTDGYTNNENDFYVEKVDNGILLRNVATSKYIKSNGNKNNVERVDNRDNATVFTAIQVNESIGALHGDARPATESVRFALADDNSLFLNSAGTAQSKLQILDGTGCWSVFYVYESYHDTEKSQWSDTEGAKGTLLTAEEINQGGITVFLHIDCKSKQVYASSENHTDDYTGDGTNDFFLEKADGGVRLRNVATGDYICGTSGDATRNRENGTIFEAKQVTEDFIENLSAATEYWKYAVRFSVKGKTPSTYLNSSGSTVNSSGGKDAQTNFTYAGGTGCWSIFFVYAKALPVSLTKTQNLDYAATFSAGWNTRLGKESTTGIYAVKETDDQKAILTKVETEVIPAGEGIILLNEITDTEDETTDAEGETTDAEGETTDTEDETTDTEEKYIEYLYYTNVQVENTAFENNLLVGLPEGGRPEEGNGTAYVFAKDGDDAVFKPLRPNNSNFAANKAYLWLDSGGFGTNALAISFGGTATGIDSVASTTDNDAPKYDLFGRRVTNVAKGSLYIQGGKKYIAR